MVELGEDDPHDLQHVGHDGVEATRADVLHPLVRLGGDPRDLLDTVVSELEPRSLGGAQGRVLLGEGVLGLGHDADEVLLDRKSTRLNSSHVRISYAVFCLKKKKKS